MSELNMPPRSSSRSRSNRAPRSRRSLLQAGLGHASGQNKGMRERSAGRVLHSAVASCTSHSKHFLQPTSLRCPLHNHTAIPRRTCACRACQEAPLRDPAGPARRHRHCHRRLKASVLTHDGQESGCGRCERHACCACNASMHAWCAWKVCMAGPGSRQQSAGCRARHSPTQPERLHTVGWHARQNTCNAACSLHGAMHSTVQHAQRSAACLDEVVLNERGTQQQRPAVPQVLLRCNRGRWGGKAARLEQHCLQRKAAEQQEDSGSP